MLGLLLTLLGTPLPVLAHDVERGDLLSASDFVLDERPTPVGPIAGPGQVLGKEALRHLAAGSVVKASDVAEPRLVKRGEPVTLVIRSGSLLIRAQGRALGDGRKGDLVRVVATPTNRTLDGMVEGSGAVRLGGE
ncbi:MULTISPECIES: flagellar basal body P-ring formation chaperone FlgA [Sphingomonas]|uniref:flagellar basal body P-ring formation chaperone FlgA n=1 Tax=Sphingomonas TaxID=13687 RepID=UPI000DEFB516|nr:MULTISPECIES: flagellar basal body P-ring formation chaperone FlgA [Sphingomonas]